MSHGLGTGYDFTTITYRQVPVAVPRGGRVGSSLPLAYGLLPYSPNPFNPSTTIVYTVPAAASLDMDVVLEVFALRGDSVASGKMTLLK